MDNVVKNELDEKIICSTTDSIEVLSLPIRAHNALRRAHISTIGDLLKFSEVEDRLFGVRNLGEKGVSEILKQLEKVKLLDKPLSPPPPKHMDRPWTGEVPIIIDLGPPTIPRHEVVQWQKIALAKQLEAGTLHPQLLFDGYTLSEIVNVHSHTDGIYEILLKVLTAPVNVSQELERLLDKLTERELNILISRNGFERQTLETVASAIGVTRERVRQIEQYSKQKVATSILANPLYRIRSAILFADNQELSFDSWAELLLRSGLLGDWTISRFVEHDRIEMMTALIRLSDDSVLGIELPSSFSLIFRTKASGKSSISAKTLYLLESIPPETNRLISRHYRHSGAVSVAWLSEQDEIPFDGKQIRTILVAQGYFEIHEDWYMSADHRPESRGRKDVFHNSLIKMTQYCGPLEIRDIYFGIEHTLVKTNFPVPSQQALANILPNYCYTCEENLWYCDEDEFEELNTGERIIWEIIHRYNGVAHHSELMQAIIESPLSSPSLHATLRRSPLFDNFEKSLYKVRGSNPTASTVQRARKAAERVPVNLSVTRDTHGNIKLEANLGILAIAHGTILSDRLPNLSGSWKCSWGYGNITEMRVTEKEIRGLAKILNHLGCEVGDRIELIFNVFDRSVYVQMAGSST